MTRTSFWNSEQIRPTRRWPPALWFSSVEIRCHLMLQIRQQVWIFCSCYQDNPARKRIIVHVTKSDQENFNRMSYISSLMNQLKTWKATMISGLCTWSMQTAANLSVIVLASTWFFRFRGCKRASTHCSEHNNKIDQITPLTENFKREMQRE